MSHTQWSSIEQEVWQVVEAFNKAFAANDPEQYFVYIDPEITVLTPSNPYRVEGIVDDREEFEYSLREGYTRVGYFQEMQPYIRVYGDTALVTYFTRGRYGVGEKSRVAYLKETDILVKRASGWKIVHLHLSATVSG